jgi:predicted MPP superfamily phosphohydrolase
LERKKTKRFISERERRWALTPWSSIYEYDVPLRNLPIALHGLSIVHLSDVHLLASHRRPVRELTALADLMEHSDKKVDLVILSGDLITKGPEDLCPDALRALRRICTVCPLSYMVHGNHDYHGHVPALISHQLESVGFKDINNKHITLTIDGVRLNLYGVDDEYFGLPIAPRAVPEDEVNILVTHNLDAIRRDCASGLDLILSGHTHWGEIRGVDGASLMRLWGYCDNVNGQIKHWEMLNDRTLSFVHPGLARYYVPWRGLRHPPGFAIHTLVPHPVDYCSKR